MMIKIQIARTAQEKERIFEFRYLMHSTGKATWRPRLNHQQQLAQDPADDKALLFYATSGSQIVGTLRLNINDVEPIPESIAQRLRVRALEKVLKKGGVSTATEILIDPHWRGQTLASLIMIAMFEYLVKNNICANFVGAHRNLRPLYERLGYQAIGPEDEKRIVPMILCVDDYDHLIQNISPFAMSLRLEHQQRCSAVRQKIAETYSVEPVQSIDLPKDLSSFWSEFSDQHARVFWNRPGILDGLNKKQRAQVMKMADFKKFKKGRKIPSENAYWSTGLVLEGKIGDGLMRQHHYHWYDIFQKGDTFGKPILNESQHRKSELYVIENAEILLFDANFIEKLKKKDPILATKLTMNLIAFLQEKLAKSEDHPSLKTDISLIDFQI